MQRLHVVVLAGLKVEPLQERRPLILLQAQPAFDRITADAATQQSNQLGNELGKEYHYSAPCQQVQNGLYYGSKRYYTVGMPLDIAIEGVLFYKASAVKKNDLVKLFGCTSDELGVALAHLQARLQQSALRVLETDNHVQLVTAPELDGFIDSIRKEELKRDIGKAGAETLAIILYKGPVNRADIDRIRGVNSSFIIRNLMIRGLIERNPDGKSHTFDITPELLAHLGVSNKNELPDFAIVLDQIEKFEREAAEEMNT